MTTLFALSCPEIGMLPPIDRFSLGDWLALRSIKLQYICLYIYEILDQIVGEADVHDVEKLLGYVFDNAVNPTKRERAILN